ncbi:hypothetical protein [Massilia sp. TSP1-1-2]|uniref:hypothetical protein n=1 Tax=Massilia sp. TSP1-1-2 TaxID=2804649 RepID=UPI003CF8B98F
MNDVIILNSDSDLGIMHQLGGAGFSVVTPGDNITMDGEIGWVDGGARVIYIEPLPLAGASVTVRRTRGTDGDVCTND